jgi:hypothetical protein
MTLAIRMMAAGAAMALVASACNTTTPQQAAPPKDPAPAKPADPVDRDPGMADVQSPLPDAQVTEIATGKQVNAQTLVPASMPVLLWFWAPH